MSEQHRREWEAKEVEALMEWAQAPSNESVCGLPVGPFVLDLAERCHNFQGALEKERAAYRKLTVDIVAGLFGDEGAAKFEEILDDVGV